VARKIKKADLSRLFYELLSAKLTWQQQEQMQLQQQLERMQLQQQLERIQQQELQQQEQ
jgi:hypothetical protein